MKKKNQGDHKTNEAAEVSGHTTTTTVVSTATTRAGYIAKVEIWIERPDSERRIIREGEEVTGLTASEIDGLLSADACESCEYPDDSSGESLAERGAK